MSGTRCGSQGIHLKLLVEQRIVALQVCQDDCRAATSFAWRLQVEALRRQLQQLPGRPRMIPAACRDACPSVPTLSQPSFMRRCPRHER